MPEKAAPPAEKGGAKAEAVPSQATRARETAGEEAAPETPEERREDAPEDRWKDLTNAGPAPAWFGKAEPDNPYRDGLPPALPLDICRAVCPRQPEELIRGVLRKGHKLLLSGSSKAGKSFLLMELCVALSEGREWLGFRCRKSRVLYVNLEIDPSSAVKRFLNIYRAMGLEPENDRNIFLWNLRGKACPIGTMAEPLIERLLDGRFDAVILDPVYKVLNGDENSASEMSSFCNYLDHVCEKTGCAVICCHHHSKGDQTGKRVADRASGSGVFGRDPDAMLDLIELEPDKLQRRAAKQGATAWRMESCLREFRDIPPLDIWFEYPLHRRDETGALAGAATAKRR